MSKQSEKLGEEEDLRQIPKEGKEGINLFLVGKYSTGEEVLNKEYEQQLGVKNEEKAPWIPQGIWMWEMAQVKLEDCPRVMVFNLMEALVC